MQPETVSIRKSNRTLKINAADNVVDNNNGPGFYSDYEKQKINHVDDYLVQDMKSNDNSRP